MELEEIVITAADDVAVTPRAVSVELPFIAFFNAVAMTVVESPL